ERTGTSPVPGSPDSAPNGCADQMSRPAPAYKNGDARWQTRTLGYYPATSSPDQNDAWPYAPSDRRSSSYAGASAENNPHHVAYRAASENQPTTPRRSRRTSACP